MPENLQFSNYQDTILLILPSHEHIFLDLSKNHFYFYVLDHFLAAHLQWNVVQVLLRVEVNYLHFLAMIFKNILFCANRYFPYISLDI